MNLVNQRSVVPVLLSVLANQRSVVPVLLSVLANLRSVVPVILSVLALTYLFVPYKHYDLPFVFCPCVMVSPVVCC
jgi:hypothetical protein